MFYNKISTAKTKKTQNKAKKGFHPLLQYNNKNYRQQPQCLIKFDDFSTKKNKFIIIQVLQTYL